MNGNEAGMLFLADLQDFIQTILKQAKNNSI